MKKKDLYSYAVFFTLNGKKVVKDGQTTAFSREEAISYVLGKTLEKARAFLNLENIIYCEKSTELARRDFESGGYIYFDTVDSRTGEKLYPKYDDYIRDRMKKSSLYTGSHTYLEKNDIGQNSREVHVYPEEISKDQIYEEHIRLWNEHTSGSRNLNNYKPRKEQIDIENLVFAYILSLGTGILNLPRNARRFLINAKMRSGKCFISYRIAKKAGYKRILILTYKPGGVGESWGSDIDHIDFEGARFTYAKNMNSVKFDEDFDGMQVIFASFQDAIGEEGNKKKWQSLFDQSVDLVIVDEMHYGSDTEKANDLVHKINCKFVLNLSGTPIKALQSGKYGKDQIAHWTYMQEQIAKREWEELKKGWENSQGENPYEENPYEWLPELAMMILKYPKDLIEEFSKEYKAEEGVTMYKLFKNRRLVNLFLDTLWSRNGAFLKYEINHTFISLPGVEHCNIMEKAIKAHSKFKEFTVINVAGDNENRIEEVKIQIKRNPRTITLSCGRFNTGSTVKEWDSVFMLNDTRSTELYFQTVFRPGTPWKEGNKRVIHCFDYNYNRVLEVIGKYSRILSLHSEKTPSEVIREFLDTAPVHVFADGVFTKVNFEDISNHFITSRSFSFGSENLFDDSNLSPAVINILAQHDETNGYSLRKKITDDPEGTGKNFIQTGGNRNKLSNKQIKDLKSCARTITLKIPGFMYTNQDSSISCTDDIFMFSDSFFGMTGETVENFRILLDSGFISKDILDESMIAYSLELSIGL